MVYSILVEANLFLAIKLQPNLIIRAILQYLLLDCPEAQVGYRS